MEKRKYIYGPVPSRRLGFSLGVDIVPYKTCSFDCVYCQLGRTTNKIIDRKEYFPKEEILQQIVEILRRKSEVGVGGEGVPADYITFSGSGEPTLNSGSGWLIKEVKKITKIPVAVLTNGSLLYNEQVREDLLEVDLIVPSLDAGNDEILKIVNRPHTSLNIDKIVSGLKEFRKEFKGKIWLEIMLVKGINDSLEHIRLLKSRIEEIKPDKVQLNTVVRPPAEDFAHPLSLDELENIKNILCENCEVIAGFKKSVVAEKIYSSSKDIEDRIIALIKRRPVTLTDMNNSLGIHRNELIKYLEALERQGSIKRVNYAGITYYE